MGATLDAMPHTLLGRFGHVVWAVDECECSLERSGRGGMDDCRSRRRIERIRRRKGIRHIRRLLSGRENMREFRMRLT